MRKFLFIFIAVFILFSAEFVLFNTLPHTWVPNLLLFFIIFMDLYLGIRYAILSAFLAGLLKDSFDVGFFGIYTFSFVISAYLAVLLKRYIYNIGSRLSRLLLVLAVTGLYLIIQLVARAMFGPVDVVYFIKFIFIPQITVTALTSHAVIMFFKQCASKSYV